jgi:hypothetical protein
MARKPNKPVDMSRLFQSSAGTLAQIASKTNSLTILADIVRQICPDLPSDAWKIANFRKNTLVLEVTSPVWGQRLQFERNKIAQTLTVQTDGQFQQIEIKVNPYNNRKASQKNSPEPELQTLSQKTVNQLLDVAEHAPKGLKEKLQKLAQHVKK